MAWRALVVADLDTKLTGAELKMIQGSNTAATHVSNAIINIMETVRGYVAASPEQYVMGAEGTIPARLIEPTLCLLVPKLYSRSAGLLIDLNETRAIEAKNALDLMKDLAHGKFKVEEPTAGTESDEDSKSGVSVSYVGDGCNLTHNSLKGL